MSFNFDNLIWGLSDKTDGAMNLKYTDFTEQNIENRTIYFKKFGINISDVVSTDLVHSDEVSVVTEKNKGQLVTETDGLITNCSNLFLTVTGGDCVPIFFYDKAKRIIGLAHAGWRGVVKNIAKSIIEKMKIQFNSDPEDIFVYIGPHLKKCHFEVQDDVAGEFKSNFVSKDENKTYVDLLAVIKLQLSEQGLNDENIIASPDCTYCNKEKYYSYRRDKPKNLEAMIAFIGLTK